MSPSFLLGYPAPSWDKMELANCFPKRLHHLTIPSTIMRVPISSYPYQHLLLSVFLIIAILVGVKSYLIVFWIFTSLIIMMEHLFTCLLVLFTYSLEKCIFRFFTFLKLLYTLQAAA
uniref:Uncharacterized protein n=1 Tax=Spermophilus dauricus TaxID=99837 RepID=A0A8C9Q856_SPEDA